MSRDNRFVSDADKARSFVTSWVCLIVWIVCRAVLAPERREMYISIFLMNEAWCFGREILKLCGCLRHRIRADRDRDRKCLGVMEIGAIFCLCEEHDLR